jgi:flagellar motor switch protein FliM
MWLWCVLMVFVGAAPTVVAAKMEMVKYGTFRNRLQTPASLHLFSMAPLRGQGVVVVSPALAFGLVDRVFGGPGRLPEALGPRVYSAIELQLIQRLVGLTLGELTAAWEPLHPVAFAFARSESSLASVALAGPADMMVLLPLECDLGPAAASLTIALPFDALEPLKGKLGEARQVPIAGPDGEWRRRVMLAVRAAEVTVTAELGGREISGREVLAMRVGDVLALESAADDPLALCVEGVPLLQGVPGVSRGNNAVRILGREG